MEEELPTCKGLLLGRPRFWGIQGLLGYRDLFRVLGFRVLGFRVLGF